MILSSKATNYHNFLDNIFNDKNLRAYLKHVDLK